MYYITNQHDQIIAADENFLASLGLKDMDALLKEILLEKVSFVPHSSSELQIKTDRETLTYATTTSTLSTLLGDAKLVLLSIEEPEEEVFIPSNTEENKSTLSTIMLDDAPLSTHASERENNSPTPIIDTTPIVIDIEKVSASIGISKEDYKTFLDEYIDTAISLEDDLRGEDGGKRASATETLLQLSEVLELRELNTVAQQFPTLSKEDLPTSIDTFYQILSRITTTSSSETTTAVKTEDTQTHSLPKIDSEEVEKASPVLKKESFGKIYLEDVSPIYFNFKMQSAADDLSLPVELIEEFVDDFIDQSREETDKMLKAYEIGDLESIQKIGHLLKGAASNLRINPLADTLAKIQFCTNPDTLEDLIENYWAHFLSFEQQIKMNMK